MDDLIQILIVLIAVGPWVVRQIYKRRKNPSMAKNVPMQRTPHESAGMPESVFEPVKPVAQSPSAQAASGSVPAGLPEPPKRAEEIPIHPPPRPEAPRPAPATPIETSRRRPLVELNPRTARQAFIAAEVLGKPKSRR